MNLISGFDQYLKLKEDFEEKEDNCRLNFEKDLCACFDIDKKVLNYIKTKCGISRPEYNSESRVEYIKKIVKEVKDFISITSE